MSAWRGRRSRRTAGPRPGDVIRINLDDVLDGYPCPYCSAITAPDADGIWACLCGWSGAIFAPCDEASGGHAGIA